MGVAELPLPLGSVLAGKYRVDRVLGAGGMGIVAVGRHLKLGQKVAIKMLRPSSVDRELVARFEREAQAASRLSSEHVVRIFDVGETQPGVPFMVMEYLEGSDLSKILKERGPLPIREAVDYVLQACEGLAEAHKKGIVHRDMKPGNLFVTRRADGSALVKVVDFGISKLKQPAVAGEELTHSEMIIGSPLYMAPEQLRSPRDVDARADIWGLGAILYKLVTDKVPFYGSTTADICVAVLTRPLTRVRELRADVPTEFDDAVAKCLQREPADRFASVAELAQALEPVASDEGSTSVQKVIRVANAPVQPSSVPPPPDPEASAPSGSTENAPPPAGDPSMAVHVTFGGSTSELVRATRPRSLWRLVAWLAALALIAGGVGVVMHRKKITLFPASAPPRSAPAALHTTEIPPPAPTSPEPTTAASVPIGMAPSASAHAPAPTRGRPSRHPAVVALPSSAPTAVPSVAPIVPSAEPPASPPGLPEYGGRK